MAPSACIPFVNDTLFCLLFSLFHLKSRSLDPKGWLRLQCCPHFANYFAGQSLVEAVWNAENNFLRNNPDPWSAKLIRLARTSGEKRRTEAQTDLIRGADLGWRNDEWRCRGLFFHRVGEQRLSLVLDQSSSPFQSYCMIFCTDGRMRTIPFLK